MLLLAATLRAEEPEEFTCSVALSVWSYDEIGIPSFLEVRAKEPFALPPDVHAWIAPPHREIGDQWLQSLAADPFAQRIHRLRLLGCRGLSDPVFGMLERFPELRALDLNSVESSAARIAHLGKLPVLEHLRVVLPNARKTEYLRGRVSTPRNQALARLASLNRLKTLELGWGPFRASEMEQVATMLGLQALSTVVDGDAKSLGALAPLQQLESLDLTSSQLRDADLSALPVLPKLRRLVLARTSITGPGLGHLKRQPRLEELDVTFCRGLEDAALKEIAALRQLRRVRVTDTIINFCGTTGVIFGPEGPPSRLTGQGLAHFADATHLRNLQLVGLDIRDPDLASMHGLVDLEHLDLSWCMKLTELGVERLRAALPACRVDWRIK